MSMREIDDEGHSLASIKGATNVVVKIMDEDTGGEASASVSIMSPGRKEMKKHLYGLFTQLINALWPEEEIDDGTKRS
jgi:hypothetical protein